MAARSEQRRFSHPYPVVLEACTSALPTHGLELRSVDAEAGRVELARGASPWSLGEIVTVHLGCEDATSTSVVVDSSLRSLGLARRVHHRNFEQVFTALDRYFSYYFGRI